MDLTAACARVLASVATDHRETVLLTRDAVRKAAASAGVEADVVPFGSTVAGLAVEEDCDVDSCIVCEAHASDMHMAPERRMKSTVKRVRDGLAASAGATKIVAILSARVPILKFDLTLSTRNVPVDLCFNNLNGCRNSELMRMLAAADARFRPLAMLVKLWAKRRDLIDSPNHYFSSYALVLLVVHFMQQRGLLPRGAAFRSLADDLQGFTPADTTAWIGAAPPQERSAAAIEQAVTPRSMPVEVEQAIRQMVADEPTLNAKRVYPRVMEQFGDGARAVTPKDVRALLASIKTAEGGGGGGGGGGGSGSGGGVAEQAAAAAAAREAETLPALLCGFFAHHARPDAHRGLVYSLRTEPGEQLSKSDKGWSSVKNARRRYSIEDPLELDFDTARMLTVQSMHRIKHEFWRANAILAAAAAAAGGGGGADVEDAVLAELLRNCADDPKTPPGGADAPGEEAGEEDAEADGEAAEPDQGEQELDLDLLDLEDAEKDESGGAT